MQWLGDETVARVVIPMSHEAWVAVEKGPDLLAKRALDELAAEYGYREDEIEYVRSDPLFQQSVKEKFWDAKRFVGKHRGPPRNIKIEFHRPGSRDRKQNEDDG